MIQGDDSNPASKARIIGELRLDIRSSLNSVDFGIVSSGEVSTERIVVMVVSNKQ